MTVEELIKELTRLVNKNPDIAKHKATVYDDQSCTYSVEINYVILKPDNTVVICD